MLVSSKYYLQIIVFSLIAILWVINPCLAQEENGTSKPSVDTSNTQQISEKQDISYLAKHNAMKSALIPGWGQLENKQYLKIPIIYAGIASFAYLFYDNYSKYRLFTQAYIYQQDQDPTTEVAKLSSYTPIQLLSARASYRRNLDYVVLLGILGYAIQVIDAAVFTHLSFFDISPSVGFQPYINPASGAVSYNPNIKFQFNL